jgi:hypothetical protein
MPYVPVASDKNGKITKSKANGQYIIFGPICFVQMNIDVNQDTEGPLNVTLPAASMGTVKQSLSAFATVGQVYNLSIKGMNVSFYADKADSVSYAINGSYRTA